MQVKELRLAGLKLITPRIFPDSRGKFLETYSQRRYKEAGIDVSFVQDNLSFSEKGVIRGLHFQSEPGQAKLVSCLIGEVWDVVVDLRKNSATFGQYEAVYLNEKKGQELFVPVGFAHGFCVLSERAAVFYKVSNYYNAETERSIRWNDPLLAIDWPCHSPKLSERDQAAPLFSEIFSKERVGCESDSLM